MTGILASLKEYETGNVRLPHDASVTVGLERFLDVSPFGADNYRVSARQFVGVFPLTRSDFVYVTPKIGIDNVLKMFDYAYGGFRYKEFEGRPPLTEYEDFLKLLVRILTDETKSLVQNHYRRFYRPRTENTGQIRGKVLVSETLRKNRLVLPKAYCEYAEFTSDILDNRIIKYALFLLLGTSAEIGKAYPQLRALYPYFDEVELVSITPDDFLKCHYDRLNQPYERVHRLCRLFIEHSYVAHLPGNYNLFCYAFDMNSLFEEFVREVLKVSMASYGLRASGPGVGYLDVGRIIKIKPDVEVFQGDDLILLLDCKYKKTQAIEDDTSPNSSLPLNSDVYQILAYMVAHRIKKGVLVYPRYEGQDTELSAEIAGETYSVYVRTIDLTSINDANIEDFSKRIYKTIVI